MELMVIPENIECKLFLVRLKQCIAMPMDTAYGEYSALIKRRSQSFQHAESFEMSGYNRQISVVLSGESVNTPFYLPELFALFMDLI